MIDYKKVKTKDLRNALKQYGFKNISKLKKHELIKLIEGNNDKLEGAGFFDFLKGIGRAVMNPIRTIKKIFNPMEEYNYESEETIKNYGNLPIIRIEIIRTPIGGLINTVFNLLSLGKWEEVKKKYSYDKLFHLAMKVQVQTKNGTLKDVFIEKEEAPKIHIRYKNNPQTEIFPLTNYYRGTKTIKNLLDETIRKIGNHNFFKYEAFSLNCQKFIIDILKSNELLTDQAENFILQPMEELVLELPEHVRGTAKFVTDAGSIFGKLSGAGIDNTIIYDDFKGKNYDVLKMCENKIKCLDF